MLREEDIQSTAENLAKIYSKLQDKEFFLSLTGDALAYTANKIAAMKALLVDAKRVAELEAKNAETEYKRVKAEAFRRLTTGDGKLSATAASTVLYGEPDVVAASNRCNEAEVLWNFVKSLVADGHDQVESLRGRLIDLQGSRKDERIG